MSKLTKKENTIQVVKFVLFSISAGVIQLLSFTLLNELIKWSYWPSYLIALTLSVLWNFTLNREFTFKSANNVPIAMLKVAAFYLAFTPLSTWWGQALTNVGWNEYLVLFFTMVINMVTEFVYCRFFVYSKSINTNKRAQKVSANANETANTVEANAATETESSNVKNNAATKETSVKPETKQNNKKKENVVKNKTTKSEN